MSKNTDGDFTTDFLKYMLLIYFNTPTTTYATSILLEFPQSEIHLDTSISLLVSPFV